MPTRTGAAPLRPAAVERGRFGEEPAPENSVTTLSKAKEDAGEAAGRSSLSRSQEDSEKAPRATVLLCSNGVSINSRAAEAGFRGVRNKGSTTHAEKSETLPNFSDLSKWLTKGSTSKHQWPETW